MGSASPSPSPPHGRCCPRSAQRQALGLFFVALVIVVWVAQAEVAQFIQVGSYNKPFFLTWCNHVFAVLMLPVAALGHLCCVRPRHRHYSYKLRETIAVGFCDARFHGIDHRHACGRRGGRAADEARPSSTWPLFLARVFAVALTYQVADYVWYLGLPLVSVTIGTVLFNVSCVYTYLLSLGCCMERQFSVYKLAGIALTVGGVLMVSGSQVCLCVCVCVCVRARFAYR